MCQIDCCARIDMRIDDIQSHGIVHGQIAERTLLRCPAECLCDILRVRFQIALLVADKLRTARRAGGRHQQLQLRMHCINRVRRAQKLIALALINGLAVRKERRIRFRKPDKRRRIDLIKIFQQCGVCFRAQHDRHGIQLHRIQVRSQRADRIVAENKHDRPCLQHRRKCLPRLCQLRRRQLCIRGIHADQICRLSVLKIQKHAIFPFSHIMVQPSTGSTCPEIYPA